METMEGTVVGLVVKIMHTVGLQGGRHTEVAEIHRCDTHLPMVVEDLGERDRGHSLILPMEAQTGSMLERDDCSRRFTFVVL